MEKILGNRNRMTNNELENYFNENQTVPDNDDSFFCIGFKMHEAGEGFPYCSL